MITFATVKFCENCIKRFLNITAKVGSHMNSYKWSGWSDFIDWIYVNTTRARLRHRELPKEVKPICRCLPLTNYSGWLFLYCQCLFRNPSHCNWTLAISHRQTDTHAGQPRAWFTALIGKFCVRKVLALQILTGSRLLCCFQINMNIILIYLQSVIHHLTKVQGLSILCSTGDSFHSHLHGAVAFFYFFIFVSSLILNAFRSTTTHPESLKLICSSFPENDLGESSRPGAYRSSSPCENDLNSVILAVSNRLFDRS